MKISKIELIIKKNKNLKKGIDKFSKNSSFKQYYDKFF